MGCGAVEIGGIGKGGSKPSFESGRLFRDYLGWERGRVEDRRTLSYESVNQTRLGMPKKEDRNWRQLKQADETSSPKLRLSRQSTSWTTEALNGWNRGWESLKTDADTIAVATVLLILAKKERRFLPLTAGKGSRKQPRNEKDVVAIRQRTVKPVNALQKYGEPMQSTHTNPPWLRICCWHALLQDLP